MLKKKACAALGILAITLTLLSERALAKIDNRCSGQVDSHRLQGVDRDIVPDAETAERISKAVLSKIYGDEQIGNQLPFDTRLDGDRWIITGTTTEMQKKTAPGRVLLMGVAQITICRSNGRVLKVVHGRG